MKKIESDVDSLIAKLEIMLCNDDYHIATDTLFEKKVYEKMTRFNLHVLKYHRELLDSLDGIGRDIQAITNSSAVAHKRLDILETMLLSLVKQEPISFIQIDKDRGKMQ